MAKCTQSARSQEIACREREDLTRKRQAEGDPLSPYETAWVERMAKQFSWDVQRVLNKLVRDALMRKASAQKEAITRKDDHKLTDAERARVAELTEYIKPRRRGWPDEDDARERRALDAWRARGTGATADEDEGEAEDDHEAREEREEGEENGESDQEEWRGRAGAAVEPSGR